MMDGGMGSMMGWMMGLGMLGWVVVIALLVAIFVVLVRLATRLGSKDQNPGAPPESAESKR
jgi:uncharacterized membrane protein